HMLAIMKDSQVGSFGVVAIVAVLGLKLLLLAAVPTEMKLGTLLSFPVLGRWAACYAMVTQPYARSSGGLGAPFVEGANRRDLMWASIITIAIVVFALRSIAVPVIITTLLFTMLYVKVVKGMIGGMTGDTLGALIELAEVVVLFVVTII
ncbi:MAG TPA: adenosylcobinamide-GDP ribazoletransferase, partial [Anaerolineae bacterium]|nr:adenosylcobinamide-GDP ribazoletransferase [Anaerolineae bacterium]